MKRVGGISIIGPALYYTCHIEFKKKRTDRRGAALYIHKEEYLLSDENHNTDSFSFLLCRRIIGTPSSFSVGDITNQQLSASCFDVKLCWPATKEKSGPSHHRTQTARRKESNMMKRRAGQEMVEKDLCAVMMKFFSSFVGSPRPCWLTIAASSWENVTCITRKKDNVEDV